MAKAKTNKKILWAVDPFQHSPSKVKLTGQFIEYFDPFQRPVEPVYVLSPDGLNWGGDFSPPWVKEYKPLAESAVTKAVKKLTLPFLLPAKVLVNKQLSLSSDVSKLVNYSNRSHADLVVVNTHARKGAARMFMGSFTEELLMKSKKPVLVINPSVKSFKPIRKIMFATDLSKASKRALNQVAKLAKGLGAELVLYHKVTDVLSPYLQTGAVMTGGGWVTADHFLLGDYKDKEDKLNKWAAEVKKRYSVKCKVEIEKSPEAVVDGILARAKKSKADLIAVNSRVGRVASFFIGSVGRELCRQSQIPTWIVHSKD